jgi:hypothetical protein
MRGAGETGAALLRRPGLLIAGVHKGSACALSAQVGVVDGRARLVGGKAADKPGVGLEFGRTAGELSRMAQNYSSAAMHGLDDAAHLDVHVAVLTKFADFLAVFPEADDCEAAGVVRGLGRADVEEAGAVSNLNNVINVGGYADIFLEQLRGLFSVEAGLGCGSEGSDGRGQSEQDEPMRRAQGHEGNLRKAE